MYLQLVDCRCDEIVETDFGRTFGRSNAYWGHLYYPVLILLLAGHWAFNIPSLEVLFIITLLAFAYSIYLGWGLFVLKVVCRPCLAAHIVNLLIFALLLWEVFPLLFIN